MVKVPEVISAPLKNKKEKVLSAKCVAEMVRRQALVQAITKDGPHGLMKHEAKWIVRARESVTRGFIEPRLIALIPRHENLADPGTATRGPTDFIPMRDATLSSHQHALTTQEIAHREAYPHVREARANIASRRAAAARHPSAAQAATQQATRERAQQPAGL